MAKTVDKRKILIQIDSDPQASVFDRVVAIDAGADEVFSYGGVKPENVQGLVHGAIFTRAAKDLKHTALFIGGSDVAAAERLVEEALTHMLPQYGLRVSILLDANGANTTSAAAVRVAGKHLTLGGTKALVLGATGPVGQRVARLLAGQGAIVRVASRQLPRAKAVCETLRRNSPKAQLEPVAIGNHTQLYDAVKDQALIITAGAAGVTLLPIYVWPACNAVKVAIDLNAVPPPGIEGIGMGEAGVERNGVIWYGALGVGATKMKLHRAAIARLFESKDQILDAEQVFALNLES
jgi:hypothetical protein